MKSACRPFDQLAAEWNRIIQLANDIANSREVVQGRDVVDRLNAVRNAVAHSFYPQNRFQYRKQKKVLWRDMDVFSFAGFSAFDLECQQVVDYFMHRAFGEKQRSLTAIKD